jgi:sulfur transfer protein SufE
MKSRRMRSVGLTAHIQNMGSVGLTAHIQNMRSVGLTAHIQNMRNSYRDLVGKLERKINFF